MFAILPGALIAESRLNKAGCFLSGWISKRSLGQARSFGGFSTYPLDVIRATTFLGLFTIPAGHDAWPHEASRMRVRANVIFVRAS